MNFTKFTKFHSDHEFQNDHDELMFFTDRYFKKHSSP